MTLRQPPTSACQRTLGRVLKRSLGVLLSALVVAAASFGAASAAEPHGKRPKGVELAPLFQLRTQHGAKFSRDLIRGFPTAIFFGYTHCPDVCPTTMIEMTHHLEWLGKDGDRFKVLFITIDPERDSEAHLKEFTGSFDRRIIALTGSPLEIAAAAHGIGATYERAPSPDGQGYTMDHTTKVFLLDRYGLLAAFLDSTQPLKSQRETIKRLINQ